MKTILITGGSRGIGRNIVEEFAKEGYNVFFTYNNSETEAKEIKRISTEKGYTVEYMKVNIQNETEIKAMIENCIKKFNNIDILVNNAGISYNGLIQEMSLDKWNEIINTNLTSVFLSSKEVIPYMLNQGSGLIINISSIWGQTGASCEVAYSTSKAGINGFTKALAKELGPSNIRVNSIAPGMINTDMNKNIDEESMNRFKYETPLEKIGNPIDITKCIKWLAEDEFTTGQVIGVNGGYIM